MRRLIHLGVAGIALAAMAVNVRAAEFSAEAKVAGSITNAQDWTFTDTRIQAADGSAVAVKDSNKVTGLPSK